MRRKKRQTLVLNANYEPLHVEDWESSIIKLVRDKADLLESYDEGIQGANDTYSRPCVVRLSYKVDVPRKIFEPTFTRENVYYRDDYSCQYCGESKSRSELTLDHVLPKSRGGQTHWNNIVASCKSCNLEKGDRTPQEADMPDVSPETPTWGPVDRCRLDSYPDQWTPYLWHDG